MRYFRGDLIFTTISVETRGDHGQISFFVFSLEIVQITKCGNRYAFFPLLDSKQYKMRYFRDSWRPCGSLVGPLKGLMGGKHDAQ